MGVRVLWRVHGGIPLLSMIFARSGLSFFLSLIRCSCRTLPSSIVLVILFSRLLSSWQSSRRCPRGSLRAIVLSHSALIHCSRRTAVSSRSRFINDCCSRRVPGELPVILSSVDFVGLRWSRILPYCFRRGAFLSNHHLFFSSGWQYSASFTIARVGAGIATLVWRVFGTAISPLVYDSGWSCLRVVCFGSSEACGCRGSDRLGTQGQCILFCGCALSSGLGVGVCFC